MQDIDIRMKLKHILKRRIKSKDSLQTIVNK